MPLQVWSSEEAGSGPQQPSLIFISIRYRNMYQAQSIEVIHYILTNCRNTDTNINLHYTHHQHLLFVLVIILFLQTHNICVDCVECGGGRGELRCRSIVRVFTIITFNCRLLRHRHQVLGTRWVTPVAVSPPRHRLVKLVTIPALYGASSEHWKEAVSLLQKWRQPGKVWECEITIRSKPNGQ